MKFNFPRSFVLSRLQERIAFLEERREEAIKHDMAAQQFEEALAKGQPSRGIPVYGHRSAVTFEQKLQVTRFTVEHLPQTETIECDLSHALLLGLVDPKRESEFGFGVV